MFCLTLSPALRVTAQANSTPSIVKITGDKAKKWVDTTQHAIEKGEVKKVAPLSTFDFEGSQVYDIGGGVTFVAVPLHGNYSLTSNVTVFFKDNAVLQTNETLITKNVVGNFQVNKYLNGVLTISKDTGIAYKTNDQMLAENPTSGIQPMGKKKLLACLTVALGVSGTVATLIVAACAGVCGALTPVTAPVCAACIGGFAVVSGVGITGAVACFNLK